MDISPVNIPCHEDAFGSSPNLVRVSSYWTKAISFSWYRSATSTWNSEITQQLLKHTKDSTFKLGHTWNNVCEYIYETYNG